MTSVAEIKSIVTAEMNESESDVATLSMTAARLKDRHSILSQTFNESSHEITQQTLDILLTTAKNLEEEIRQIQVLSEALEMYRGHI